MSAEVSISERSHYCLLSSNLLSSRMVSSKVQSSEQPSTQSCQLAKPRHLFANCCINKNECGMQALVCCLEWSSESRATLKDVQAVVTNTFCDGGILLAFIFPIKQNFLGRGVLLMWCCMCTTHTWTQQIHGTSRCAHAPSSSPAIHPKIRAFTVNL